MNARLIKSTLMIFVSLFLIGCAGSVKIVGRGCQTFDGQFVNINKEFNPNHTWQRKVWTYGGEETSERLFTIEEILQEKDIECRQVALLRYRIGQSFWDQLFSLLPFMQRMTLEVEVQTKS